MDKAVSDSAVAQFRAAFPDGTFTQVDVLEYGDDPDVEPGEKAIRAFVAGLAAEPRPSRTTRRSYEHSRRPTARRSRGCIATASFHRSHGSSSSPTPQTGGPRALFCGASQACSSECALT